MRWPSLVPNGGKYQAEYRLMLPDGTTRWISSQGRVEFDATGQPVLIRGAARDVTARKQAEQETQLLRQEIAHAGRVSMMGQLASGLAHEINQPLASILRNAEAAELFLQHPSPDLDEIRAILSDIRSDDERAGQVIDRMRGLLKRQTLDTAAARRGRAGRRRGGARAGRCRDAAGEAGRRCAGRICRTFAATACRFSRCCSISFSMGWTRSTGQGSRIGASMSPRGSTARRLIEIAVGDAGHGIPADKLARIFDPFFTTKPNGMGIGLAVSRTIVEAHGGRLWAENRNGGGAAFRFTLPIAEEGAAL